MECVESDVVFFWVFFFKDFGCFYFFVVGYFRVMFFCFCMEIFDLFMLIVIFSKGLINVWF